MSLQFASNKLPGKKGSHKDGEGAEMPSQTKKNSARNDKRDGKMYCQHPLPGKSSNPRSPIAERHIYKKDETSRNHQNFQFSDPSLQRYSFSGKGQKAVFLASLYCACRNRSISNERFAFDGMTILLL
jgi:hypothetical protein